MGNELLQYDSVMHYLSPQHCHHNTCEDNNIFVSHLSVADKQWAVQVLETESATVYQLITTKIESQIHFGGCALFL